MHSVSCRTAGAINYYFDGLGVDNYYLVPIGEQSSAGGGLQGEYLVGVPRKDDVIGEGDIDSILAVDLSDVSLESQTLSATGTAIDANSAYVGLESGGTLTDALVPLEIESIQTTSTVGAVSLAGLAG